MEQTTITQTQAQGKECYAISMGTTVLFEFVA